MTLRNWDAFRVDRIPTPRGLKCRLRKLGVVVAENQPEALAKAWKQWPQELDHAQVQAGFSLRLSRPETSRPKR